MGGNNPERNGWGAVVISGASTGIGEACAIKLASLGYQVFAGVRKEADAVRLSALAGDNLTPIQLDVTDPEGIQAAAGLVSEATGEAGLRGLINNAGVAVASPLEFIPLERLRQQFEVNTLGQIAVTQAFLPAIRRGNGRLIFISSISGLVATPFLGPYAASKFALEALADALRRELRPWPIPVAVIEPGRIQTPIWEKSLAAATQLIDDLPEQAHAYYGAAMRYNYAQTASKRGGTSMEKVTRAVLHALIAARPRPRYLVGMDAKLASRIVRWLPVQFLDWLIARQRGIE